jgi:hypothetical protein
MSCLRTLCASAILDAVQDASSPPYGDLRPKDLVQGSALFVHMLDSIDPLITACGDAAVHKLLAAGAIPLESCQEQLLQTIQQATSLSSSYFTQEMVARQAEQHVLATLQHAIEAMESSGTWEYITHDTLPVLLNVFPLPKRVPCWPRKYLILVDWWAAHPGKRVTLAQ